MTTLDFLSKEGVIAFGILEKLSLKKRIIKQNPNLIPFLKSSYAIFYKIYYLNLFLRDLLENFEEDTDLLYKKVPFVFPFYKGVLDYIEFKTKDKSVDLIIEIIEKLEKVNLYILKMVNEKKGSLKFLNLLLKDIQKDLKERKEVIEKFIEKYEIKIPEPSISETIKNFAFSNKTFLSLLKTQKTFYPFFRADFFSKEKFFPISLNEVLLNEIYTEDDEKYLILNAFIKFHLGLILFENEDFQNFEKKRNENDFFEIIEFLIDKILKDVKDEEDITKYFFFLLDKTNKTLKNFFLENEKFFLKDEIKIIYKEVLKKVSEKFFDEKIANIINKDKNEK